MLCICLCYFVIAVLSGYKFLFQPIMLIVGWETRMGEHYSMTPAFCSIDLFVHVAMATSIARFLSALKVRWKTHLPLVLGALFWRMIGIDLSMVIVLLASFSFFFPPWKVLYNYGCHWSSSDWSSIRGQHQIIYLHTKQMCRNERQKAGRSHCCELRYFVRCHLR